MANFAQQEDTNFKILKHTVEFFGGAVFTHSEAEGVSMLHVILPLNFDTIRQSIKFS